MDQLQRRFKKYFQKHAKVDQTQKGETNNWKDGVL